MNDDAQLLRRYVSERSESAFTELVERKAGLVYSAALRQVGGDTLLAQDVSQGVFIDLARKAGQLTERTELTSWLYTSTRFAALNALREQHRRQLREQEAHTMEEITRPAVTEADWEKVRPLLDAAICDLPDSDRSAVLMRYFESQPFAVMGEKLGIGESSARMRAERALDKLRGLLAQKGITSTAAVLALVLSTKAVAAPPVGLAASLAGGALAKSAAIGTGAGLFVKAYHVFAMNKVTTGVAAAVTVTAAGVASYEVDESARHTAFFIYAVCFGVGLLFAILSVIFGHLGHSGDGGVDHGADLHGHAEAGFGAHDMPGFEPIGPTTIATFVTAFGGIGMVLNQSASLHRFSGPLAAVGALAIAAVVGWGFALVFRWAQGSSEGRISETTGLTATVITPIPAGGVGEIAYVQAGSRYSAPARTEDGTAFPNGATVRITRVVGTQFYVSASG
ncbi:MAG: sigma-70 family RNA polymerase sigma factor [Verrucomicrobia bacterium]|nr:sigma-70 family RNA polymerase sigma factor [Verrucomicrobiota bacterium]